MWCGAERTTVWCVVERFKELLLNHTQLAQTSPLQNTCGNFNFSTVPAQAYVNVTHDVYLIRNFPAASFAHWINNTWPTYPSFLDFPLIIGHLFYMYKVRGIYHSAYQAIWLGMLSGIYLIPCLGSCTYMYYHRYMYK